MNVLFFDASNQLIINTIRDEIYIKTNPNITLQINKILYICSL